MPFRQGIGSKWLRTRRLQGAQAHLGVRGTICALWIADQGVVVRDFTAAIVAAKLHAPKEQICENRC
jgi:hypothetical protein